MILDPATSAKITGYRPQKAPPEWDHVCGHVQMLVAASAERSPYRVERLLTATTRLAVWCTAPACRITRKCGCGTRRSTRSS
ncbi:hypothetical protein [Streptosporangium amethystogenes]|uniref:hypothetical protein n=1 Tax=Streptosporangium amethystogenes TaxID=2002 RepID=UPI0012F8CBB6|nr:hypothetical protein [Streptosporangium amethystogenes]